MCLQESRWMPAFFFLAVNRKRPTGCSILIAGGDGGVTAKRGLFWYVDGELLCFPVSGDEADTVSNNHRRFWETLPHSLTCGMPYNYFPRGRVELRHGKAVVYLHPSLCTPELIPGFAMLFRCRMRCRYRSRPTGAGITEVFRRNRRGRLWTFSDL